MVRTVRAFAMVQPAGQLSVQVGRGREGPPGHERGLEEPVPPFHQTLGLRVIRPQPVHAGRQGARVLAHPVRVAFPAADPSLSRPTTADAVPRRLLEQLPHPQQQINGGPGRQDEAPQVLCRSYAGCGSRLRVA